MGFPSHVPSTSSTSAPPAVPPRVAVALPLVAETRAPDVFPAARRRAEPICPSAPVPRPPLARPPALTALLVSTDSRAGEEGAIRSVDHAVVGGVVAVVVFAMLCLLIILGRYFARHKGKKPGRRADEARVSHPAGLAGPLCHLILIYVEQSILGTCYHF